MLIENLETPALLIDIDILNKNIEKAQNFADKHNLKFRPHIKTHKMPYIALQQIKNGAKGIAVSTLKEALVMTKYHIKNIHIANIIADKTKLKKLVDLNKKINLYCSVDSFENAKILNDFFLKYAKKKLKVLIEIDTGLKRCGLSDPYEVLKLVLKLKELKKIKIKGIFSHAGHSYSCTNLKKLKKIITAENKLLDFTVSLLKKNNIQSEIVSYGATPLLKTDITAKSVNELRIGNYVFNDFTQVLLNNVKINDCALTVFSTIISKQKKRIILDAGSKALSSDKGVHGKVSSNAFGYIIDKKSFITRLSEEHGIIDSPNNRFLIGEKVKIIPNHACSCVNLFKNAYLIKDNKIFKKLKIYSGK